MTENPTPETTQPIRAQNLPITVHAQYVKDISFENPNAPASLRPGQGNPDMDVAINLEARPLEDEKIKALYELTIQLRVKASREKSALFLASVDYSMIVSMPDIPQQQHHPVLLVEVPKLGFPFVRQVLANLVQDGGFPPLLLTPVDFGAMYLDQFAKKEPETAVN